MKYSKKQIIMIIGLIIIIIGAYYLSAKIAGERLGLTAAVTSSNITTQLLPPPPPTTVKIYRAILSQTNTNAPVATVLENSLGFNFTWSRPQAGIYYLNAAPGNFKVNKTFITVTPGYVSSIVSAQPVAMDGSQLALYTGKASGNPAFTLEDNVLYYTYLQILVYP